MDLRKLRLPTLAESKPSRLLLVMTIYLVQGVEMGFFVVALPAYLIEQGMSTFAVGGFISAVVLPWTFKLLFAPVMERYTLLDMGRRRPWILLGSLGGVIAYGAAAMLGNPLGDFGLFTAIIVMGSLFLAVQDIATGALACEIFPAAEIAQANSYMWASEMIGVALASASGAWLLYTFGLSLTLLLIAGLVFMVLLIPLSLKERSGERILPWSDGNASAFAKTYHMGSWKSLWRKLRKVVFLPSNLLVFFLGIVLSFNEGLIDAFGPVFTVRELHWSSETYLMLRAVSQFAGATVGILLGSLLLGRYGFRRCIYWVLAAAASASLSMVILQAFWQVVWAVKVYFMLISSAQAVLAIIFFAIAMRLSWKPVAGIQFSMFLAIANVGYVLGSGLMATLIEWVGSVGIHAIMLVFAGIAALLATRIDVAKTLMQITLLDRKLVVAAHASPRAGKIAVEAA